MVRAILLSIAVATASVSAAQAQSATETLGFLLGGFDKISPDQTSHTEHYSTPCIDESKDGCYHEDQFIKIDDCHYKQISIEHQHWIAIDKTENTGVSAEKNEKHVFDLDMSQAAMIGENTNLMGEKRAAIIGGDKLDCGDMDVGDGTFCTNYELLQSYPKPIDPARAQAAFAYFQKTFCKGRAF